jgi:hypothetical protein
MAAYMLAVVLAFGIFGVVTGIGLLRLRNWARISTLVWSGVTVVFCGLIMVVMAIAPFPTPPNAAVSAGFVRAVALTFYGPPLAIGVWWLILFNRKSIVAQFMRPTPAAVLDVTGFPAEIEATRKPECPLVLMVLAGFLLLSALSMPFVFFFPEPAVLFGHALRGLPGTIFWIASCLSCAAAGIGLLRLRPWGYWLALGLQAFWFLSGIVTLTSSNYAALMQEVLTSSKVQLGDSYHNPTIQELRPYMYFGLAAPLLVVAILLFYRSRFFAAVAARRSGDR